MAVPVLDPRCGCGGCCCWGHGCGGGRGMGGGSSVADLASNGSERN